jgi:hypothetical protein
MWGKNLENIHKYAIYWIKYNLHKLGTWENKLKLNLKK